MDHIVANSNFAIDEWVLHMILLEHSTERGIYELNLKILESLLTE